MPTSPMQFYIHSLMGSLSPFDVHDKSNFTDEACEVQNNNLPKVPQLLIGEAKLWTRPIYL